MAAAAGGLCDRRGAQDDARLSLLLELRSRGLTRQTRCRWSVASDSGVDDVVYGSFGLPRRFW